MLRAYHPIVHTIFTLHGQLEHLVCQVWCNASDTPCSDILSADFEIIYNAYDWLKTSVDDIYEKCKPLTPGQRADIREAFIINNRIEDLCYGIISPIPLGNLPSVVKDDMKPLLVRFYKELLDRTEVAGDKLDYYNKLIEKNKYKTCPCCGLSLIESAETHYREDNDHYLSIADFPFAAVNFKNLVPLCGKCNKKCKGTKNPFEPGRVSFYAFNVAQPHIEVNVTIVDSVDLDYRTLRPADIFITFNSDVNKTTTWNWLFNTNDRYNEETRSFSKTELRTIANRLYRNNKRKHGLTYEEILDDTIEDYEVEVYEDRKFLKIPFLKEMKNKPDWMAVYE